MNKKLLLIMLYAFVLFADESKLNVAVNDLIANSISSDDAVTISNSLRSYLIESQKFNVMERKQMNEILKEQEFQNLGLCDDENCIVEIGKILTVQYMVGGNIGKIGRLYSIDLKLIDVKSGHILAVAKESQEGSLENFYLYALPRITKNFVKAVDQLKYGTISITTSPKEATVFLNSMNIGVTPIKNYNCLPDSYSLKIQLSDYAIINDTFKIEKGKKINQSYTLERTQEWKDSIALIEKLRLDSIQNHKKAVALVEKKKKKKKQWIRRLIFGGCSLGFTGAGIYMNNEIDKSIDEQKDIKSEYENLTGNIDFKYYEDKMDDEDDKVKSCSTKRNVFYSLGGAFAISLVISIPF